MDRKAASYLQIIWENYKYLCPFLSTKIVNILEYEVCNSSAWDADSFHRETFPAKKVETCFEMKENQESSSHLVN